MTFQEALLTSLANIGAHKLRSALTMLGIVFGVGAVIAMLSIGAGAEQEALETISRLGLHNVVVRAKEYIAAGDAFQIVLSQRFTRRTSAPPFAIYRALRQLPCQLDMQSVRQRVADAQRGLRDAGVEPPGTDVSATTAVE